MRAITERQQQVMQRVGKGLQQKQIAAELGVSPQAVSKSCLSVRKKLGLPSHQALISHAAVSAQV